jgi:hypothetical protein
LVAQACPACNIHNYLDHSIISSKNVCVVGCVTGDDGAVRMLVLRVIAGDRRVGEAAAFAGGGAREPGRTWIVSDPTSGPPNFPVLEWDPLLEAECRFLARLPKSDWMPGDLPYHPTNADIVRVERRLRERSGLIREHMGEFVKDADEAIILAQGISNLAKFCALSYLRRNPAAAAARLPEAIAAAKRRADAPEATWKDRYRLGNLAEALVLRPTEQAEAFAGAEMAAFLAAPVEAVDFSKGSLYYDSTPRAYYLLNLVRSASGRLRSRLQYRLFNGYAHLRGAALAEATTVLCTLGYSPGRLRGRFLAREDADYYALGVMWVAYERTGQWDFSDAMPLYAQAGEAAKNADLRKYLTSQSAWAQERVGKLGAPPIIGVVAQAQRAFYEYGIPALLILVFGALPAFLLGRYMPLWVRLLPLPVLGFLPWLRVLSSETLDFMAFLAPVYVPFLVAGLWLRARATNQRFMAQRPYDALLMLLNGMAVIGWVWWIGRE